MTKQLATHFGIEAIERGFVPDWVTRNLVRRHCGARLKEVRRQNAHLADSGVGEFAERMRRGPIARVPQLANEQHYELPPEFFKAMLGPRLKYSCCFFEDSDSSLPEAEHAALQTTCERAEIHDGMEILELGCGWGSLTLWMLENFPNLTVTAVSNSAGQRQFILGKATVLGVANRLNVITADMNEFVTSHSFDRIVSCEMFEHMCNYDQLLSRISDWLAPQGKLFIHIFCHQKFAYEFQSEGAANWMGRYFFSGGIMPSLSLLNCFDQQLTVGRQWTWAGTHYERTCNAWLRQLDNQRDHVLGILQATYGANDAKRWFQRWRLFLIACAELFSYQNGNQWMVGHFLLQHKQCSEPAFQTEIASGNGFV